MTYIKYIIYGDDNVKTSSKMAARIQRAELIVLLWVILFGFSKSVEVKNACVGGDIELQNNATGNRMWIFQGPSNHHIDLHIEQLDLPGKCSNLLVGPGNDSTVGVGAVFKNHGTGQRIRISQETAFVHLLNGRGGSIIIRSECKEQVINSTKVSIIRTKFVPHESDATEETCLGNMDNQSITHFLKDNSSLQRNLTETVKNLTWNSLNTSCNGSFSLDHVHIVWPMYTNNDCVFPNNNLWDCICFRITIKVTRNNDNDTQCFLDSKRLREILRKIKPLRLKGGQEVPVGVIPEKHGTLIYISIAITITGLSCVLFFLVWYYNEKKLRSEKKKKRQSISVPDLIMWPPYKENPLHVSDDEGDQKSRSMVHDFDDINSNISDEAEEVTLFRRHSIPRSFIALIHAAFPSSQGSSFANENLITNSPKLTKVAETLKTMPIESTEKSSISPGETMDNPVSGGQLTEPEEEKKEELSNSKGETTSGQQTETELKKKDDWGKEELEMSLKVLVDETPTKRLKDNFNIQFSFDIPKIVLNDEDDDDNETHL